MALKPLAEQPLAEELSESLSFLITQQTTVEGAKVEAIRRANLAEIVNLLENKLSINIKNGTIVYSDHVDEDHDFSTPYDFDVSLLSAMPKQGDLIVDLKGNAYTVQSDGVASEDGETVSTLLKYEGCIAESGSAVYVGDEEPADETIMFWIKPDGEADTVEHDVENRESGASAISHSAEGSQTPIVLANVAPGEKDTDAVNLAQVNKMFEEAGSTGFIGPQGPQGEQGEPGEDGTSITISNVSESTEDGGNNIVTFSDGNTLTVKNGSKGTTGATGPKGDKGETGPQGVAGVDGTDGVGIASIEQTITSEEDGGNNVFTVTLTNGNTASLTVKNGSKGSTGEKGETGAQGEKGDTGAQGPQGEPGAAGADGVDAETIPDYVITEAETVSRIINQHQSNDSIVFPFLTDAHCGYYADTTNEAVKMAGQLLELIGKRVPYDFIVNGGDMANGAWDTTRDMTYEQHEDYAELVSNAHRGIPSVWMPGNHDDAPYQATDDRATQRDMFALIGRKNRVYGAVCQNGCNYGYLDLNNRKLRIIYLDTDDKRIWGTVTVTNSNGLTCDYLNAHNIGGVQLQWLASTALDLNDKTTPAEWSIIVVSHVALNISGSFTDPVDGAVYANSTDNAATILNAYRTGKSGSITHNNITVSYDFSTLESKATIVCAVHGHNHKFTSEALTGDILSIGCPNVMNGRERESDDGNTYSKTAGTADGTSFCVLTIDRENCMIYADCVGVGYDREFEYTTEVVPYTNQIPISTDSDGNIYNGKGFKENTYLSSGNDGEKDGIYTTGFIPIVPNQYGSAYFYCENVGMQTGQDTHRLCIYNADKSLKNTIKTTVTSGSTFTYGDDGDIAAISLPSTSFEVGGYIRICCGYIGEDSVITANEEIA